MLYFVLLLQLLDDYYILRHNSASNKLPFTRILEKLIAINYFSVDNTDVNESMALEHYDGVGLMMTRQTKVSRNKAKPRLRKQLVSSRMIAINLKEF